jgi:ABC-type multidrug transport system fused ATPase/permease subunit
MLATSALDNESEKIVQDALDRAAQGTLDKRQLLFYDSD